NDHFPLPPGRYVMESAVADRLGERAGTKRVAFFVPVLRQDAPALSSIVMVRRVDPSPPPETNYGEADDRGPDPLRFAGGAVTPRLDNAARGELGFYFVAYSQPGARPSVTAEILSDGKILSRSNLELVEMQAGIFPYFGTIPLKKLAPGDYELRIVASAGGAVVEERTGFQIQP
ncbi:MAG: hypothetical protein ACPL7M_12610, partial [Bryobacteraceae bacterium]